MKKVITIILSLMVVGHSVAQNESSESYEHEYVDPFNDWETALNAKAVGALRTESGVKFYRLNAISEYLEDYVVDSTVEGAIRVDLQVLSERDHSDEEVADEACRLAGYDYNIGYKIVTEVLPENPPLRSFYSIILGERVYPEKKAKVFSYIKCSGGQIFTETPDGLAGKVEVGEGKVFVDSYKGMELMHEYVKEIGHYGGLNEQKYADVLCQLIVGEEYSASKFFVDKRNGFGLTDGYVVEVENKKYQLVEYYLSETFSAHYFNFLVCEK